MIDGETIYSVYSQAGVLLHRDNVTENKFTDYIKVAGQSIARVHAGGNIRYAHNDHLGSAVSETNTSSQVRWQQNFTPFGEKRDQTGGLIADAEDEEGFTGHISDATGLTYMQARYYDPVLGRFLSNDPVGFETGTPQQFNRYSYTWNDPVNAIDPDGEFLVIAACLNPACGAAIGAAAVGALKVGAAATAVVVAAVAIDSGLDAVMNESAPDAHPPRPLTDEEKTKIAETGAQPSSGGRTQSGRSTQKRRSDGQGNFPSDGESAADDNAAGAKHTDDILNDPGSTIATDKAGQQTVIAPDGRRIRVTPNGEFGFRNPPRGRDESGNNE